MAVADFNHDGKPDLVVVNSGASGNSISVLLGNGDGTFQNQLTFQASFRPVAVAVADLNGDGKPDVIVANNSSGNVGVFLGNGNGTFHREVTFAAGRYTHDVTVADVNGDGKLDLIATGYSHPTGSARALASFWATATVRSDHKSLLPLVAVRATWPWQTLTVMASRIWSLVRPIMKWLCCWETAMAPSSAMTAFATGSGPNGVAVADVNGDGIPDVLTANSLGSSSLECSWATEMALSKARTLLATGAYAYALAIADLNGDGRPDLAVTNFHGDSVSVLLNAANGDFTGQVYNIVSPAATHFVVSGVPASILAGTPFTFTVAATDVLNNVATGYNGIVFFTSSDSVAVLPAQATLSNGIGTFSATLKSAGTQTLTATDIATSSVTGTSGPITVRDLVVTSFTPTPSGFTVTFNEPINPSTVNLYTLPPAGLPDDVSLVTNGTQVSVRGSLVIDPSYTSITFVKTDTIALTGTFNPGSGLLSAGNYTVTLRSFTAGASGFQDAFGDALDGTGSGAPGSNFQATFSISTPPVAVGIPDFARGPSNTDAIAISPVANPSLLPNASIYVVNNGQTIPFALDGFYMHASSQDATQTTLVMDYDLVNANGNFDHDLTIQITSNSDGTLQVTALAREDETHQFSLIGANGETIVDNFEPGASFTFPGNAPQLPATFALSYTNPAATPTTGTATVTFSTTAATLQSNIQAALNTGGLAAQIGINPAQNTPNAVVVVTKDNSSGANILVTFQNALAQSTNQLLVSNTPGVSVALANINAANNIPTVGIPIALSSGKGVTSGNFTLQYNPNLLNITGVTPSAAIANITGASFTLVSNTASGTSGTAVFSLSSPSSLSSTATAITLGSLLATVPLSAASAYGATQLLHFGGVQLAGTAGPILATNQDALQVVAYLGDVTNSGGPLNLSDATTIAAVAHAIASTVTQTIPGFAAFPELDPLIIGDISLQGSVNATDAGGMTQQASGFERVTDPYAPIGLVNQAATTTGPTPTMPANFVAIAGSTLTVPVNINNPNPAGSGGLTGVALAVDFDPNVLQFSGAPCRNPHSPTHLDLELDPQQQQSTRPGWNRRSLRDPANEHSGRQPGAAGVHRQCQRPGRANEYRYRAVEHAAGRDCQHGLGLCRHRHR